MTATALAKAETNGQAVNLARLGDPFPPHDIEWRIQSAGPKNGGGVWAKVLAYVTNRAIMARLDEVCGPGNWRNEFREWKPGQEPGVLCGISIRVAEEWVTKWDGAENTDVESVKGGLSSAMKRAAVQWGLGRYLYDLEEGWANIHEGGRHYAGKSKDGKVPAFRWDPPPLPTWALPKDAPPPPNDSIEANRLPPAERAAARQANPKPEETPRCSEEQQEVIKAIRGEIPLSNDEWVDILKKHSAKRLSFFTPDQAKDVILDLSRRRVAQLLTEHAVSLDDVRERDPFVTADIPEDLDQDQASAALVVLRELKERQTV